MKPNINTCGSHVAYRCHKFKTAGYNLKDYQQHVYNYCRAYGLTPDQLVAQFLLAVIFNINLNICLNIYIYSLICTFFTQSHSKIKCYCNLKCCSKTEVDVPLPKEAITQLASSIVIPTPKIINIFTCGKKHSLDKIKIPFEKI